MIYAPTVGEFSSVKPIIQRYRDRWPDDGLVLLTAYPQYHELYQKSFPGAAVGTANFRSPWLVRRFLRRTNPRLFIISEGPALHGCFPQRLDLALPTACLANEIPAVVTNAVLFSPSLGSRIDRIENALFSGLFTKSIRHWFPSFATFGDQLAEAGIGREKIHSLGDLRFDSLRTAGAPQSDELARILHGYRDAGAPVLVAGSVNAADELQSVVNAWARIRKRHPTTKLIVAPRYVNNPEVIAALQSIAAGAGAAFSLRSDFDGTEAPPDILIVDVFGELSHFYSIAAVSFIGRNHGVLEPLAYRCPTLVGRGWRVDYAAAPLYDYMVRERGVICVTDDKELCDVACRLLEDQAYRDQHLSTALDIIERNGNTAQRVFAVIERMLTAEDSRSN